MPHDREYVAVIADRLPGLCVNLNCRLENDVCERVCHWAPVCCRDVCRTVIFAYAADVHQVDRKPLSVEVENSKSHLCPCRRCSLLSFDDDLMARVVGVTAPRQRRVHWNVQLVL